MSRPDIISKKESKQLLKFFNSLSQENQIEQTWGTICLLCYSIYYKYDIYFINYLDINYNIKFSIYIINEEKKNKGYEYKIYSKSSWSC